MRQKIKIEKREELISMLLGLAVVAAVVFLIFNFIRKGKGNISLPGVSRQNETAEVQADQAGYMVKKGDSLWLIASRTYGDGFKWQLISQENKLADPDKIEVGQRLVLPTLTPPVAKATEVQPQESEHKVVRGESLWKIAVFYYNDGYQWTKIWELNRDKIRDPNKLEIGMVLRLR